MSEIEQKVMRIKNMTIAGKYPHVWANIAYAGAKEVADILGVEMRGSSGCPAYSFNHMPVKDGIELRVYLMRIKKEEYRGCGSFILTRIINNEEVFMDKGFFNDSNVHSFYVEGENFGHMSLHCEDLKMRRNYKKLGNCKTLQFPNSLGVI